MKSERTRDLSEVRVNAVLFIKDFSRIESKRSARIPLSICIIFRNNLWQ